MIATAFYAILACVLLPLCQGGLPECSPTMSSCPYGFSVPFAELTSDASAASFAPSSAADTVALCSRANWVRRDRCESDRCPLRFVVASGDGRLSMTLCVEDNNFSPYDPAKHLSHTHPLHKQPRDLVVPGTHGSATRFGCAASDYVGKAAAGKVAIVQRGACRFDTKYQAAEEAGAVAIVILQSRVHNQLTALEGHVAQLLRMIGSSEGFSIPGGIASRQDGDPLLEHHYAGGSLRGHYELLCGPITPDAAATDGCPDDRLTGLCDGQPAEEDRLCSRCPLELWVGCDGGRGGCGGVPVCLLGSLLRPRVARNYLQLSAPRSGATWTLADGELAYVRGADVAFGCVSSDWAGLSGAVVVVRLQTACTPFRAVRLAEAAGVAAYVLLSTHETERAEFVLGQSAFVGIPVHSIAGRDVSAFRDAVDAAASAAVAAPGTVAHADVVLLPTSALRVPEMPARATPPPGPDAAAIAAAADAALAERMGLLGGVSTWSPVLATGVALVVLFGGGVCGWVAWWAREHRKAPPPPPPPTGRKRWHTLPLGCASTALSLSLLVATTVVAFGMAHAAGKSSSDTAMEGGRVAAQEVHSGAVANVDGLASEVRLTVVRRAIQALDAVVQRGEQYVEALHAVFINYNGTWEEFQREALRFASMGKAAQRGGWALEVFTTSRFLMSYPTGSVDGFVITDDRSDEERADGVIGTVAETRQGWRYGTNYLTYEPISHSVEYWMSQPLGEFNTTRKMGNEIGDPIAVVAGRPVGFRQWRVTTHTFPQMSYMESYQPLSVFAPLHGPDGAQVATFAAHISLGRLGPVITSGIRDATLANMTLLVFDKETGRVIASNAFLNVLNVAAVAKPTYEDLREMYTLHTAPAVQVKALAVYLDGVDAALWAEASERPEGLHRVFDQADYWAAQPGDVFSHVVVAADGTLRDVGVQGTRVAVVGGGGAVCGAACVTFDADAGRPVLRLDGTQALYIYRNLTTDMPLVNRTAARGADGVVTNTDLRFRESMDAGDGVRCVSHSHEHAEGVWFEKCLLLHDLTYNVLTYTISIRVRPDEVVPGGWGPDTPVLFSEALGGEANVRFFANGYLMLNVLRHGCRAEGLTDGLPAGVWTTLTALVDSPNGWCRVFVNGRPHSEGRMTSIYSTTQGVDPYVVGQRFSGRMDSVRLFTILLTDAEVWRLHADDALVREVPSRVWYVELHSYERNTPARAGIDWGLAAMLPREDVLRTVNENNARTYAALLKREDDTRQKLERDVAEAACFSVAIGLFSVLVFLVFNLYLTGPITQAALSLQRAAFLEIDELPVVHSRITEVHVISEATNTMCKNVREYKSYLPLYIKAAASLESASATATTSAAEAETAAPAEVGATNPLQQRRDTLTDSTCSSDNVSVSASETSALGTPRGNAPHLSSRLWRIGVQRLMKRRVAVAVTNLLQYTRRTHGGLDLCQEVHCHALEILLPVYRKHGGIPDVFSGDKFVCMYNMASFCDKPAAAAARTALELVGALNCNTAVTTGECRVGPLGNCDMRRFCAIGPVLQWVFVLERIARAMGVPAAADRFVREALPMFTLCVRSLVFYKRLGSQPLDVCELVGANAPSNNAKEWMYELDESGCKTFSLWNDFCLLIARGRFDDALHINAECGAGSNLACAQERCPQVHAMFLEALQKKCPLSATTSGPSVVTCGGEPINMQSLVEGYATFAACDAITSTNTRE